METQGKDGSSTQYLEHKAEDGIQLVECESWLGFMTYIESRCLDKHSYIWRGQANANWFLESSLARVVRHKLNKDSDQECVIPLRSLSMYGSTGFLEFDEAVRTMNESTLDEMSIWAVGRHNGLKTPYIDWSKSPYVAAFFAYADSSVTDCDHVAIFGVSAHLFPSQPGRRTGDNGMLDDYILHKMDASIFGNQRGIAQQGILTAIIPSMEMEAFVKVLHAKDVVQQPLIKILIPRQIALTALKHLNRMNINYRTLFPDVQGVAMHANLALDHDGYVAPGDGNAGFSSFKSPTK